jgi:hypothetical protein
MVKPVTKTSIIGLLNEIKREDKLRFIKNYIEDISEKMPEESLREELSAEDQAAISEFMNTPPRAGRPLS